MSIIYYALVVFIYITPLFQDSYAKLGIAAAAAVTGALAVIQAFCPNPARPGLYRRFGFCAAIYSCCIIIGIVQCIPGFSFGEAEKLYTQTAAVLHRPVTPYLSVSPEDTVFGIIKLLTYGAVFWLGLNAGVDYKRTTRLFALIICMGSVYSIGAIYQHDLLVAEAAESNSTFYPPLYIMNLVKNPFAALIGIHLVIACALLWQSVESFRERSWEMNRLLRRMLPLLVALPLLGISLMLSASRAGIASSVIGIITLFALLVFSKRGTRLWPAIISGSILLLLVLLFGMGGGDVSERYAHMGSDAMLRLSLQRDALGAIAFFPWLGSGFNTFTDIINSYISESYLKLFPNDVILIHAYNSYLETMLTMGALAFMLLMAAILYIGGCCLRGILIRTHHRTPPAAAFAIGVILACHSFVDYSMQIPIIALLVCFIFGIGFARAFPAEASQ